MRVRKKPVEVDADIWDPTNDNAIALADLHGWGITPDGKLLIHTLEGVMTANVGDWIIRGVNGEYYPCKPDIFEKTYERVDD